MGSSYLDKKDPPHHYVNPVSPQLSRDVRVHLILQFLGAGSRNPRFCEPYTRHKPCSMGFGVSSWCFPRIMNPCLEAPNDCPIWIYNGGLLETSKSCASQGNLAPLLVLLCAPGGGDQLCFLDVASSCLRS